MQADRLSQTGKEAIIQLRDNLKDNVAISQEVGSQIDKLANKSGSISKIIDTIQSIASQTNLLALNTPWDQTIWEQWEKDKWLVITHP